MIALLPLIHDIRNRSCISTALCAHIFQLASEPPSVNTLRSIASLAMLAEVYCNCNLKAADDIGAYMSIGKGKFGL